MIKRQNQKKKNTFMEKRYPLKKNNNSPTPKSLSHSLSHTLLYISDPFFFSLLKKKKIKKSKNKLIK